MCFLLLVIQLYEVGGEGNTPPLMHSVGVCDVALNQGGTASDRMLAIVDRNRDLFLAKVPVRGALQRKIEKLGNVKNFTFYICKFNLI